MNKIAKVAFLSSVTTAALVYVLLEWRPLQATGTRPPEVSWAAPGSPVAVSMAEPAPPPAPNSMSDDERNNIDVYKKFSPAVVNITSTAVGFNFLYGMIPKSGSGSGAIIDEEGHIATNYHVIEDGLQPRGSLEVTLFDKSKHEAQVVGFDADNDLAVLKIDLGRVKVDPIVMGASKDLQVGQKVLAIGNPYALERTLTTGIISALGRSIQAENGRVIEDIIQTDAAINHGNSGGPLLNTDGQLVGINTAILSPSDTGSIGIGFAIPADTVKRVVNDLVTYGYVRRPDLGVEKVISLRDYRGLSRALGLSTDGGLLLWQLTPDGPAARAGLRGSSRQITIGHYLVPAGGDVLLAVDGREVNSMVEVRDATDRYKAGERITVTVLRNNQKIDLPVVLRESPPPTR